MKLYFEKKLEWIPIKLQEIFYLWDYISLIIQRKEIGRGGSDETVQNNAEREYKKKDKGVTRGCKDANVFTRVL